MKHRTLWFCQSVALATPAMVAPLGRRRRPRDDALLRSVAPFGGGLGFRLGNGRLWTPSCWRVSLPASQPSCRWALPSAGLFRNGAVSEVVVASAFVIVVLVLSAVDPLMTIHHSGAPGRQGLYSGIIA